MKQEIDIIKFQYYAGNIKSTKPLGVVALRSFIDRHQFPMKHVADLIDEIEEASASGDKKKKKELKESLFYFTPGAVFSNKRKYDHIVFFTGLAQIDIDGLDPDDAKDLKSYLFENYEQFYCIYTSPSRKGIKGLMRIPICKSIEEFKEYYAGIEDEFNWIAGFDSAPKNLALPLFLSYDHDILYRENAEIWNKKGEMLEDKLKNAEQNNLRNEPIDIDFKDGDETVYKSKAYYRKITLDIFENKIDSINDNGHPQLRSACLILGSRIGAGYLNQSDAEQYAEAVIRRNSYLSKGTENYLKTMRWAINQGTKNPKYYE